MQGRLVRKSSSYREVLVSNMLSTKWICFSVVTCFTSTTLVKSQLLYLHTTGGYEKTVIRLIEIFSRLFNKGLFNDGLIGVSILLLISESF